MFTYIPQNVHNIPQNDHIYSTECSHIFHRMFTYIPQNVRIYSTEYSHIFHRMFKQTKKVGVALVGPYIVPQECLSSDGEFILEPNLLK